MCYRDRKSTNKSLESHPGCPLFPQTTGIEGGIECHGVDKRPAKMPMKKILASIVRLKQGAFRLIGRQTQPLRQVAAPVHLIGHNPQMQCCFTGQQKTGSAPQKHNPTTGGQRKDGACQWGYLFKMRQLTGQDPHPVFHSGLGRGIQFIGNLGQPAPIPGNEFQGFPVKEGVSGFSGQMVGQTATPGTWLPTDSNHSRKTPQCRKRA